MVRTNHVSEPTTVTTRLPYFAVWADGRMAEEENSWLVIDCGTDTIKAGYSGDDDPIRVFDCVVNIDKKGP